MRFFEYVYFSNNYDVPFKERRLYENNPEEQFKRIYRKLFKEIINSYDKTIPGRWVINRYVDQNRKEFGLVEKRKDSS